MTRSDTPEMQLIELLRRSDEPTAADRDRIRKNVALQLTAGATVAATWVVAEHGSWLLRGGSLAAWLKGATLATILVGAGIATTHFWSVSSPPPPAVETQIPAVNVRTVERQGEVFPSKGENAPPSTPKTETSETPPVDDTVVTNSKRTGSPTVTTKNQAYSASTGNLEAELVLIGQAQRALKAGQPGEALRSLDEHQRRFPAGVLSFERAGVRTVALCQSGRLDEGRTAARNYLRKVPNSVLSKRIRVACQMTDE
jgi:hypothetical protein